MPRLSEKLFPRPARRVEVAPGIKLLPVDLQRIPALAVAEAVRKNVTFDDGTRGQAYVFVERIHDAWLRVNEAAALPLGMSSEVIVKLVRSGFVDGARAAPCNILVNVRSLLEHYETCREDPDFWTPERVARFQSAGRRCGETADLKRLQVRVGVRPKHVKKEPAAKS